MTGKLSAFAPGATIVHLDIDPAEISKLRNADIPVVGPLEGRVRSSRDASGGPARRRRTARPWLAQLAHGATSSRCATARATSAEAAAGRPGPPALTAGTDDVVWTTGVGQHQMWAMQYVVSDRPRSFITSGGLGTMGYGIPAAIGAKAARPDATVVCVDGDGCFQMTAQELATAVLEDLPIVVVIVNNAYLGMVRQWQDMFFDGRLLESTSPAQCPTTPCSRRPTAVSASRRPTERGARHRARGGARFGADRRRRLPRRPGASTVPDDPRRRRRARHARVPGSGHDRGSEGAVRHTLSVLVENKPGALTRITTMFARRGFNIECLAVGPTERPGVSCITLRVDCAHTRSSRSRSRSTSSSTCCAYTSSHRASGRARALVIRVSAPPEQRAELMTLAEAFGGRVPTSAPTLRPGAHRDARGARRLPRALPSVRDPRPRPHRSHRRLAPAAARHDGSRPSDPRRATSLFTKRKTRAWPRSSVTATSPSSTAPSPSSGTGARATRTRSTSSIPASGRGRPARGLAVRAERWRPG